MSEEVKNEEVKDEATVEAEMEVDATDAPAEEKKPKKENKAKNKEQIAKLEAELKNLKNEYLKVYAEMENTKKRLKDEAIKDRKYASQKVVGELINPVDMLVQIVNMPAPSPEIQNYVIGFQMIANQLTDVLKAEGLAPIEVKVGSVFDPKVMNAMQTEEHEDMENDVVVKVMQNGYMYKDRVLRPAMVVVNKKSIKKEEE